MYVCGWVYVCACVCVCVCDTVVVCMDGWVWVGLFSFLSFAAFFRCFICLPLQTQTHSTNAVSNHKSKKLLVGPVPVCCELEVCLCLCLRFYIFF